MRKLFLSLFAALLAAQTWAQDFTIDNLSYYITDADNHYVSVFRGPEWPTGNLIIPSTVSNGGINYTVTGIRDWAFNGCRDLTSVTIPESITSINHYAFSECSGLTSITIPKSVTSIGCTMVMDCNNLTEIIVDSENENYSSSEDGVLFNKDKTTLICCPAAKTGEYSIPEGVTTIGDYAFWGCVGLTSVIIPETVKSLGTAIFHACTSLTSIHIPKSVNSIAFNTFMGCNNLTTIYVDSGNEKFSAENGVLFNKDKTTLLCYPAGKSGAYTISESVSRINDASFYGCRNLTSVTIPNSITAISYVAFHGCSGLTAITIPETVTVIERGAFEECTGLTSVNIPENVTEIGYEAFCYCSSLNSLTIPENVTEIGNNAFYGVRHIVYSGNVEGAPWGAYYVNGSVEGGFVYADEQHKTLNAYIGTGGSVTIPSTVETISDNAFSGCSSITSINIPGSVTSVISSAMFSTCNSLTAINVDSENTAYSSNGGVLFNKDKTTLICYPIGKTGAYTIPETVTTISEYAFYGCSGLTAITIPSTVTSITYDAFGNCDNLKTLTCNTNALGSRFAGNTSLETVNIGESVTYINGYAFQNCTSLKSIDIPNTVTEIYSYAFQNCTSLTSIDIPNSVQYIYDYAFSGCTGLTSVSLGNTLKYISNYAFQNCTGLTSITFPNTLTYINKGAFEGCTNLTIKNIPESVKSIGLGAFTGCTIGDNSPYNRWLSAGNMWYTDNSGVAYTYVNVVGGSEESAYRFYNLFHGTSGQATGAKFKLTFDIKWKSWDNETDNAIVHLLTGAMVNGDEHADWQSNADENTELVFENGFSAGQNKRFVLKNSEWTTIEWGGTIGAKGADWLGVQLNLGDADGNNRGDFYIKNLKVQMGDNLTEYFKIDESNAFGYELNDDGGATVTNCYLDGDVKEITIPATATIDGKEYAVTRIGDNLFSGRSKMTSVSLPESVTTIGYYAFCNCTSLASITIPESVTTIEYDAFDNCTSLTSINIPQAVANIGSDVFYGCSKLAAIYVDGGNENFSSAGGVLFNNAKTELICYPAGKSGAYTIPSTVTSIGWRAFICCIGLTSITIPNSVNYISNYAFQGCTGLTSIDIPKSVSSVDGYSFFECSNLTAINVDGENEYYSSADGVLFNKDQTRLICYPEGKTGGYSIPNTVASIGNNAFQNCSGLSSIEIPNSVTEINSDAFLGCSGLTSVTIPNSVTYIGRDAFDNCTNLTSVTIPESVTEIEGYAFYGCSNLASINIPTSVTSIGNGVFNGCDKLSFNEYGNARYLESNGNPYYCLVGVKSNDIETCTINSNCELINLSAFRDCYRLQYNENDNAYYLPSDDNDFYLLVKAKSTDIASCTIHSDCKYIGSSAFYNCNSMETLDIPASVKSIAEYAFSECYNIKKLTYNTDAFKPGNTNKSNLETVVVGDAVTNIPDYTFNGCGKLKSVTIGNSVESIGERAFQNCEQLQSVTIGNSVESIGNGAFYNCKGLNSIVIPETVKQIEGNAFVGCSNLTSMTVNTDAIGTIFSGLPSLKTVNIGSAVTTISDDAFNGCNNITSVSIESDADFSNAGLYFTQDGIRYHVLNKNEVEVVQNFVDGTNSYSGDVVIPETVGDFAVTGIGNYAFENCDGLNSVTIGNSVETIGNNAFNNCDGLTSVIIPESVKTVGDYAFAYCDNLSEVTYNPATTTISENAFEGTKVNLQQGNEEEECLTYEVRNGAAIVTGYKGDIPENLTIPSTVTIDGVEYDVKGIGDNAFNNCENLKSVTIGNSVVSIGENAFNGCSNLESITINSDADFSNAGLYFTQNGIRYHVLNKDEVEIVPVYFEQNDENSYTYVSNSWSGDLVIPDTITIGNNYAVKIIGRLAFAGCAGLTSVTIPNTVTSIDDEAFSSCIDLKSATLGNSVETIGNSAFNGCKNLETVNMGNSVKNIGNDAFRATNIKDINIPSSVTNIGGWAFAECHNLETIDIPSSVETIGETAFQSCDNIKTLTYNTDALNINSISKSNLETVVIGDAITSIPDDAYFDCENLKSVTIGKSVESIGSRAFQNTGLESVAIPESVTSISSYAFNNCDGLTSVTIPESVETVGDYAFANCDNLSELTYNPETTTIGENAFLGTKVNLQQGNEEEEYVLRYEIRDGAVIVSGYNSNIPENLTIPSTVTIDGVEYAVTGIRENAFYGCDKLKSIEISEGVETIGDKAFSGCKNLESISIPSSVSSFGGWDVFEGCEKVKTLTYNTDALDLRYVNKLPLETVVIGESVTKIQSSGFYDCSSLKSVTIGNSVETIGGYAFNNCTGLTSIEIPESVKEIGKNAFSNCTGLTSIEIPKSVKTVGDYAFANCSNLANVDYNPSTTTFGKGAFEGTKIESLQGTEEGYELTYVIRDGAAVVTGYNGTISGDLTIPPTLTINGTNYTVKGIDDNAFNNCTKLTSVTIPNSVESIGSKAFNNCTKLTSVTIPNSVESIGSKAFYNCTSLGSLTVPKSVTSIGTDAFKDVNNVVNMSKIPDGQWGAASIFTLRHDTVRMQITETKIEYIHDTIFMFRTVAVNDMSANLSIYPNPTTSFVTVKGERKFSYVLANSTGAALRRGDGSDMYVVDLSDYADGVYLLYTSDGELYKIIKE